MSTQTIAAIATSLSNSGISIIRISGKDSLAVVNKIFRSYSKLEPNKIIFGKIYDEDCILDEVLVSYFKAPKSYTGEDVCEINCHGGTEITRQILELVLENGAVMAQPGEFSKRAFLNGKMDLSQAEAVINLINAKTKTSTRIAANQLNGNLSNKIKEIRNKFIELLAHIEVSVDYPEYDYEEVENSNVIELINKEITNIDKIIDTFEQGKILKDGINVAILGKPNVGKSSLLNYLAKSDRAIVTDIAGTTRDVVEETINIGEFVLNIADTAGIRKTDDVVEKIGVERSLKKLDEVDFVIYMISAHEKIDKYDLELISKIKDKGLKYVVLINKTEDCKKEILDTILNQLKVSDVESLIKISLYDDIGLDELKKYIVDTFSKSDLDYEHELIITSQRHKDLLKKSINYLQEALNELESGKPIDIISIYIKNASTALGQIIGADVSEDVMQKIFEKFCLGK